MRIETDKRKIYVCDVCGNNDYDDPDFEVSFMSFDHGFFCEEPSFGCGSDSEGELYSLNRKLADEGKIPVDSRDVLAMAAHTSEIEMCEDCFHDYDNPKNFMHVFDGELRQRRGEILLDFVKNKKILPGFTNEYSENKKYLNELLEKEKEIKEKLKGHAENNFKNDYGFECCLDDLLVHREKIKEIRKGLD
jgi:hypothetical protein